MTATTDKIASNVRRVETLELAQMEHPAPWKCGQRPKFDDDGNRVSMIRAFPWRVVDVNGAVVALCANSLIAMQIAVSAKAAQ